MVIVLLYQYLTRTKETEHTDHPQRESGVVRLSVVMLLPYHVVSGIWTIKKRKLRNLEYSVQFPTALIAALRST